MVGATLRSVKPGIRTQTAIHGFLIAAGGITVAFAVNQLPVVPIVGLVLGALVSVVLREVWPSPRARADAKDMIELRGQVAAFNNPNRIIKDAERLEQLSRYGPLWPGQRR